MTSTHVAVAVAGGAMVLAVLTGWLHRAMRHRRPVETEHPDVRSSTSWRILRTPDELADALDRALACEQATRSVWESRAQRIEALRAGLDDARGAAPLRARRRSPRTGTPRLPDTPRLSAG